MIASLVAASSIPVGIVLAWIRLEWVCFAVTLLSGVGGVWALVINYRRRQRRDTPRFGISQIRITTAGLAVRAGIGPVTPRPWDRRWKVVARPAPSGAGWPSSLISVRRPLLGPLLLDEPLRFEPIGGLATAKEFARLIRDFIDSADA